MDYPYIYTSITRPPTAWTDLSMQWDQIPVLAYPVRQGQALWLAIVERISYLAENTPLEEFLPDTLHRFIEPFDPNEDYKRTEKLMYDAIIWLLPQFTDNATKPLGPWTIESALLAIGEEELLQPVPYYLSAKWLLLMYKLVNLMERGAYVVSISFIDESEPIYRVNEPYASDKYRLETEVPNNISVFHVDAGESGAIIGPAGLPINVKYRVCSRDNKNFTTDFENLKNTFIELYNEVSEYRIPYLGIFVDVSGSMGYDDVQGLVEALISWAETTYELAGTYIGRSGDERWLYWTVNYIQSITGSFAFSADVRVDLPET